MVKWNIVQKIDRKIVFSSEDLEEVMDKKEEVIAVHGTFDDYMVERINAEAGGNPDGKVTYVESTIEEESKDEEPITASSKQSDAPTEKDIQKIYIKNFGNLVLEILGSNEIGIQARSTKKKETLFIPWTSIIFCSKLDDVTEY